MLDLSDMSRNETMTNRVGSRVHSFVQQELYLAVYKTSFQRTTWDEVVGNLVWFLASTVITEAPPAVSVAVERASYEGCSSLEKFLHEVRPPLR
jgi:hypothetical protein